MSLEMVWPFNKTSQYEHQRSWRHDTVVKENEKSKQNKKRAKISEDMIATGPKWSPSFKTQSNHLCGLSDKSLNHAWAYMYHGHKNH